jgi:choline dehydrogenase
MEFDYIVVGAGSAGCAVAGRLARNPKVTVLLLEAGPNDTNPLIHIPKGFGKLQGNPKYAWHFPARLAASRKQSEVWVRGKVLGGSSAINGMVYNRGNAADFDRLEEMGNVGWNWKNVLAAYKAIEDNALGPSPTRGAGGPLGIGPVEDPSPLCAKVIAAGDRLGWCRVEDINETDAERIGYSICTIRKGRRFSSARAFIAPILGRPNFSVQTGVHVQRLLRERDRVVGVAAIENGAHVEFRARREIVLSLGSINTPKLLQLSGIGPADVLRATGVDVVVDAPMVGGNLREHRCIATHWRLKQRGGYNHLLTSRFRQNLTGLGYLLTRKGPMSTPAYEVQAFVKTLEGSERPDAQLLISPISLTPETVVGDVRIESEPGLHCIGYILRPESQGRLAITSADPAAPLDIAPNYLTAPYDRDVALGIYRSIRKLLSTSPIADLVAHETQPGAGVTDEQVLIDDALNQGYAGYHSIGTCAMGPTAASPLDPQMRVRGLEGLRVVDTSVVPTMVAGNLNAPMMAFGWRTAELMLGEMD